VTAWRWRKRGWLTTVKHHLIPDRQALAEFLRRAEAVRICQRAEGRPNGSDVFTNHPHRRQASSLAFPELLKTPSAVHNVMFYAHAIYVLITQTDLVIGVFSFDWTAIIMIARV